MSGKLFHIQVILRLRIFQIRMSRFEFFKDRIADAVDFVKLHIFEYFLLVLPFFLMEIFIRFTAGKIDYDRKGVLPASILFSVIFITSIVCM